MDPVKRSIDSFNPLKRVLSLLMLFMLLAPAAAETLFEQGEKLFMENKPEQAVMVLEEALKGDADKGKGYLYLGICYEQLGQFENAVSAYSRGLDHAGAYRDTYLFNMANNYLRLGQRKEAAETFGMTLEVNASYAPAYLNRGNLRVGDGSYRDAISDYRTYLTLRPEDPQKEEIERMIARLSGAVQELERQKLEDERKRREEAARQQALLDQVLGSLENAGSDTTNLSAGTGESEDYDQSFDIID